MVGTPRFYIPIYKNIYFFITVTDETKLVHNGNMLIDKFQQWTCVFVGKLENLESESVMLLVERATRSDSYELLLIS